MIINKDDAVEQIQDYYPTNEELKGDIELDSFHDTLHEIADSNCDVYTHDLLKWVAGNYSYVEDAQSEFGPAMTQDGKPDFIRGIMQGQYMANMELLNEAVEEIKETLNI